MKNKTERSRWLKDRHDLQGLTFQSIDENSIVFDVGLHLGGWSNIVAKEYNSKIYGFEPVVKFYEEAKQVLSQYPKVEIFNFGLGGLTRQAIVSVKGQSTTLVGKHAGQGNYQLIHIEAIKEFMERTNISRVDLICINIEGAEYELLESMVSENLMLMFGSILVQFHEHVHIGNIGHRPEREAIRKKMLHTHEMVYSYDTIWDLWRLK